ncbi:MAG: hypothetical protein ACE5GB_13650 [Acidimicrobiales bacterium]
MGPVALGTAGMTAPVTVGVTALLLLSACAGGEPGLSAWCGLVAEGAVVALDADDAVARWSDLEQEAPDDLRADVQRLRVTAQQVAGLDPDDLDSVLELVVTPRVVAAHDRVITEVGERCRIDVATLTVIDSR